MLAGIDLFAKAISRLLNHDFFEWTRQILEVPGRTVRLNMLGIEVLMTDDAQNTKAILSTKVSRSIFRPAIYIIDHIPSSLISGKGLLFIEFGMT